MKDAICFRLSVKLDKPQDTTMAGTNLSTIKTDFSGTFKAKFAISRKLTISIYCKNKEKSFIFAYCTMKPLFFKSQETRTQYHEV